MKKLAVILAFLMLVPGAAFGLEMMNDSAMDDVTGQAGVSIAFDDIQLFLNIERIAWIDKDGFTSQDDYNNTAGSGGAVGIQDFQLDVLEVNAIVDSSNATSGSTTGDAGGDTATADAGGNPNLGSADAGELGLNFDYSSTTPLAGAQIDTTYSGVSYEASTQGLDNWEPGSKAFSALSIDATSQLPALSQGKNANVGGDGSINIGGVLIGLPTVEVTIPNMSLTMAFYNLDSVEKNATGPAGNVAHNDVDGSVFTYGDCDYGTVEMTGITFSVLNGWMEIAPH